MSYPTHPAAELFPMMPDAELRELAEDIKANGLLERIVLHDGMILDGRNRLRACEMAGVTPLFANPDPPIISPWVYVLSKNLHRRHLTVSQRAAIAAETLPYLIEENKQRREARRGTNGTFQPSSSNDDDGDKSVVTAAKAAHVGESSIQRAWNLKQHDPEAFEKVKRGEITVTAARNGHREQPQRGGQRIKDVSTPRGKQLAEANKRRMIDGIALIGGVCHGLANLDVAMAGAACNAEEIGTWATKAENHARELRRFAARLKGVSDNGESAQSTNDKDAGGCTSNSPDCTA